MGIDAGTPPGIRELVQRLVDEGVAKFARSGFLRNASITDGGLTVKGGFLRVRSKANSGVDLMYVGPVLPNLPDGSSQQAFFLKRVDNSFALSLFDADVADGQLNQTLRIYDRNSLIILAEDANLGEGLARPYIPIPMYTSAFTGDTATNSTEFTTLWRGSFYKMHPNILAGASGYVEPTATAEVRLLVNGIQIGQTRTVAPGASSAIAFPSTSMAGRSYSQLTVELQARIASGAGLAYVLPGFVYGVES